MAADVNLAALGSDRTARATGISVTAMWESGMPMILVLFSVFLFYFCLAYRIYVYFNIICFVRIINITAGVTYTLQYHLNPIPSGGGGGADSTPVGFSILAPIRFGVGRNLKLFDFAQTNFRVLSQSWSKIGPAGRF